MRPLPVPFGRTIGKSRPLAFLMVIAMCGALVTPAFVKAQETAVEAPQAPQVYRPLYDFTGDNKTDFTTITTNTASPGTKIIWKTLRNPAPAAPGQAFMRVTEYGVSGDGVTANNGSTVVANDFIGDAKTDIAIWHQNFFYLSPFPESGAPISGTQYVYWGSSPTTVENLGRDGDYDGDGKDDPTSVRLVSSLLTWYIKLSGGGERYIQFGRSQAGRNTLAFQGADFTGDGRDEIVYATGATTGLGLNTWFIGDSVTGATVLIVNNWGSFVTDYFINPDDYTGDGKADIVCWRAGGAGTDAAAWYIRDTATGTLVPPVVFGIADPAFTNADIPIRGNYDGDNRADIGVWRPSTATYYWLRSSDGIIGGQQWGTPGSTTEIPLEDFFCF